MHLKIVFIRRFILRLVPRKLFPGYREEFDYDFSVTLLCKIMNETRLLRSSEKNLSRRDAPSQ